MREQAETELSGRGGISSSTGFALTVLFCINTMNFYDRLIPGAVSESIKKAWNLSDAQLGDMTTAFILLYAVVGIPLGRLSDRFERRRILGTGVFVWSILTAMSGLAQNFGQMIALRLSVGVGEASCAPAANSLIGDLYPARRRARALSIFMLGLPIGNALCYLGSGLAEHLWSWRAAFFVACVPGLLCAFAASRIREPERGAHEVHKIGGRRRDGSPFMLVLRTPTMRWIIISGALQNFTFYTIGAFLKSDLLRTHQCSALRASILATCIFGLSGIPGLLIGGYLGDRVTRTNGRLIVGTMALALAVPLFWFALASRPGDLWSVGLLAGAACMLMYMYYSTVYSTIQDVVEPTLRGTAMAVYFFAMYILGGAVGPVVVGRLSDYFAHRAATEAGVSLTGLDAQALTEAIKPFAAAGLHSAMYAIPIVCGALALVLAAGARTVTADAENLRAWMQGSAANAD